MRITEALGRVADRSRMLGLGDPTIEFSDTFAREEFLRCIERDLGQCVTLYDRFSTPRFDGIEFKVRAPTFNYMDEPYLSAG